MPLRRGPSAFVQGPEDIKRKRAVVNIANNDPYCFLWSVTAALSPPTLHFSSKVQYDSLEFSMTVENVPRFEKINNFAISVYAGASHSARNRSEIEPMY